jgi:hypothetical protein
LAAQKNDIQAPQSSVQCILRVLGEKKVIIEVIEEVILIKLKYEDAK